MPGLLSAVQIATISATIALSLDQSLPLYRKVTASDGYGHSTETYSGTPTSMIACNTYKPSASVLQTYAGIIGTKTAMMLRYLPATSDVQEGDRIVLASETWVVQNILPTESYSIPLDALMTTIS